jgi:hypothetical protein
MLPEETGEEKDDSPPRALFRSGDSTMFTSVTTASIDEHTASTKRVGLTGDTTIAFASIAEEPSLVMVEAMGALHGRSEEAADSNFLGFPLLFLSKFYQVEAPLTWPFLRPVCKHWKLIALIRNVL